MAQRIRLIHPIYLDIPMLVSFAAAVEGGLSFGSEVTHEAASASAETMAGHARFGLSNLFGSFLDVSADGKASGNHKNEERSVEKSSRSHTEASVAILLYDRLRRDGGYIVEPESLEDATATQRVEPGALVEMTGTVQKNAIDATIDYIDAADILSNLAENEHAENAGRSRSRKGRSGSGATGTRNETALGRIREILDRDRQRTPISNVLLRCSTPRDTTAVVTLRTENLRDLTLSELHRNSVRVLGKVTRVVGKDETMSAFENYGMAMLAATELEKIFQGMMNVENIEVDLSVVQVKGPALQVLPLMIFV